MGTPTNLLRTDISQTRKSVSESKGGNEGGLTVAERRFNILSIPSASRGTSKLCKLETCREMRALTRGLVLSSPVSIVYSSYLLNTKSF